MESLLRTQSRQAAEGLLEMSVDDLYVELGGRVEAISDNPSLAGEMAFDVPREGIRDALLKFGKTFFARVNKEAYSLVCGSDGESAEERSKILDAFSIGKVEVTAAIAAGLVSGFGLAPAIAAVVAALVVKLFWAATHEAVCAVWKDHVPADTAPAIL